MGRVQGVDSSLAVTTTSIDWPTGMFDMLVELRAALIASGSGEVSSLDMSVAVMVLLSLVLRFSTVLVRGVVTAELGLSITSKA